MDEFDPKFSLKPLQRKNGTWCVQATQSFAQSQYIGPFISETAANDWIIHSASEYVQK